MKTLEPAANSQKAKRPIVYTAVRLAEQMHIHRVKQGEEYYLGNAANDERRPQYPDRTLHTRLLLQFAY